MTRGSSSSAGRGGSRRTGARRRAEYGVLMIGMMVGVTVSVALVNVLATRFPARLDVTVTREHRLSPRTEGVLKRLDGPCEIVVAYDARTVASRAHERVSAVLTRLERASEHLRVTRIDRTGATGESKFNDLVMRLIEREAEAIARQEGEIAGSVRAMQDLGEFFSTVLAPGFRRAADACVVEDQAQAQARAWLVSRAAAVDAAKQRLDDAMGEVESALRAGSVRGRPVADTTGAAQRLRAQLGPMAESLYMLVADVEALAGSAAANATVGPMLRELAVGLRRQRDAMSREAERVAAMPPLDLLRVASVLEHQDGAVLVVGPPGKGLTAIEFSAVFPPAVLIDSALGSGIDLRGRAEELFATAIASLIDPARPIVVLVHGERAPVGQDPALFGLAIERLSLRGMDVVEWAAALDERPPALGAYSPGTRPVVYVCFNTDSGAGDPNDPHMSGPARAVKLGRAIHWIVDSGHPLLMSVTPSSLPAVRQADPTVEPLKAFGLESDSGRVLMRRVADARGPSIATERRVSALEVDHPIARACAGLPTLLNWCTPVIIGDSPERTMVRSWVLHEVRDESSWAESQWFALARVPREHWPLMPSLPALDSPSDDGSGVWPIVVAAQRSTRELDRPQRVVVVGANAWFSSDVLRAYGTVDGRLVPLAPGNAELLESSILWLAGQDEMIAQTATGRALPLVRRLEGRSLTLLRWAIVGVLPLGVLLTGVIWRLARG